MSRIRTLVGEDEPLARERVVALLRQEADVEVSGEGAHGTQAGSRRRQAAPDPLFPAGRPSPAVACAATGSGAAGAVR